MKFANTVCAALLGVATTVTAQPQQPQPEDQSDWVLGAFIVELDSNESPDDFYTQLARDQGIDAEHRMHLASSALFHGASIQVRNASSHDHTELFDSMKTKAQVKAVWPVRTVTLNIGKLHAQGITGRGFRIAIVDSGIGYHHPALGGCFGPGCLVETGWDLVGDDYSPPGMPKPDPDPYDNCVGHGTHVAGTIAAQLQGNEYGFTGAAPGAKLAAYRAWGCSSKATTDVLISAFLKAFDDGNDIISCSDGLLNGWSDDAWGLVSSRIVAAGVPVVISAGNDGGSGIFQASSPAGARGVTGVGAVQNAVFPVFVSEGEYSLSQKSAGGAATVTNSSATIGHYGFLAGTPAFPQETKLSLWAAMGDDLASTAGDACSPLPDDTPDLSDKLVLLHVPDSQKTRCYPIDQGENIAAKGGKYMAYIVQSNVTFEEQYIYVDGIKGVISVAPFQGARWVDALNKGMDVTVTVPSPDAPVTTLMELEDHITGGYTGEFSSWGPTWELLPKPDLTAPGGKILSTYPLPLGGYRIMTGTSMACPLVAGVLALIGEARGSLKDTNLINRLISATAEPQIWFDGTKTYPGTLAPISQQGAGMIQAYDAAFAKTILSVQSLSLNDTEHFTGSHTFSIENTGPQEATYVLGHMKTPTMYTLTPNIASSIKAGYPNPIVDAWAELRFDADSIVVPAGGSANVTVTFTAPSGGNVNATLLPVYSGYISVNSTLDNKHLVVPYLGVAGSMRSVPILQASSSFLADYGSPVAEADRVYTLPLPNLADLPVLNNPNKDPVHIPDTGKTPNMLVQPILGTRALHVDVVVVASSSSSSSSGNYLREDENSRNNSSKKTPTGRPCLGALAGYPQAYISKIEQRAFFQGLLADGTVLPVGIYRLVASALREFGDEAREEDWDVVETVPFVVKYAAAGNHTAAV
ncbi:subtilisin-like serine protease-like protein [Apiospora saccharicola]|uniref:Subtilisin-like serine protease-like protein n=1 Tax=Apiospora saccharicola TaxID=335842 RepID=A0ABR1ULB8_9PEZI